MKKSFILLILIIFILIDNLFAVDNIAYKYYQNAVIFHKKSDFKSAMAYYNAAIKKDKKFWQAWLGLGICYYNMKKFRNAQLIFRYVLMLKPGEPIATKYYNMMSGISFKKEEKNENIKKTKGDMMWRSALLPGFGQFYNNEIVKGYAYSIMFFTSIGGIIKFIIDQREAVADYENTNYDFDVKYKEAQDATIRTYIPIAIAACVWSLSVIDAYLSGVDETDKKNVFDIFEINDNNMLAVNFIYKF